MKTFIHTAQHLVVIDRGEELMTSLEAYATAQELSSAWMNGIGGASHVTLGFYDVDAKEYLWKEFEEPLEIISLQGNLSWVDGKPFWHIHGSFGTRDYQTISGHVKALQIGLTCEVSVRPTIHSLTRKFNDETGLKLLNQST